MRDALIIDGHYRAVAQCLQARIRDHAPWHIFEVSDRQIDLRLGSEPGDVPRIELYEHPRNQTDVRFFISHPESYVIQLLDCEEKAAQ